jgi:hypothetical protein
MIELNVKYPNDGDTIFSEIVSINYQVKDTDGLFNKVVFEIDGEIIEKTSRSDLFQLTLPEGEHTLVAYIKNKYNKELLQTRKTINFFTKPVTLELKNRLSAVVSSTIPDFLEKDYAVFVDFIKYYYIWLESTKNVNLIPHTIEQFLDVDTVPPELIDTFYETYLSSFPKEFAKDKETGSSADVTKIIKNIKDFYSKKGTEDSFRFLFRLMFDTEITLTYPREKLLKASQAEWVSPKLIRIKDAAGDDLSSLLGSELYVEDDAGVKTFSALIEDYYTSSYGAKLITTVRLTNVIGDLNSSKVYYKKYVGGIEEKFHFDLYSMIVSVDLNTCPNSLGYPIYDFNVGENVKLVLQESIGYLICNDPCSPSYGYIGITTDPEGDGYQPFEITFYSWDVYYESGFYQEGYSFQAIIEKIDEKGAITKIKILDPGFGYTEENIKRYGTQFHNTDGSSIIRVYDCRLQYNVGYLMEYEGRYKSKKSLLSELGILPDNYYYQQNSYEIGSNVTPYRYSDILKKNVHPAGYQPFYRYDILDTIIEKPETNASTESSNKRGFIGYNEDGTSNFDDLQQKIGESNLIPPDQDVLGLRNYLLNATSIIEEELYTQESTNGSTDGYILPYYDTDTVVDFEEEQRPSGDRTPSRLSDPSSVVDKTAP